MRSVFNRLTGGGVGARLQVRAIGFDTRCHSYVTDDVETRERSSLGMDQDWTSGGHGSTPSKVPSDYVLKVRLSAFQADPGHLATPDRWREAVVGFNFESQHPPLGGSNGGFDHWDSKKYHAATNWANLRIFRNSNVEKLVDVV